VGEDLEHGGADRAGGAEDRDPVAVGRHVTAPPTRAPPGRPRGRATPAAARSRRC
jgi:hypothetical protein